MNKFFLIFPPYILFACIAVFFSSILFVVELYKNKLINNWLPKFIIAVFVSLYFGATVFSIISLLLDDIVNNNSKNAIDIITSGKFGLVYYGGLLGVIATTYFFVKKMFIASEIYNILSFVIPLFHSISRVGCYFAGCCYGIHSQLLHELPYFENGFPTGTYRVPTQLYEACFEFIIFIILFLLFKFKYQINLLKAYVFVYSVFRFNIEFLRADSIRGIIFSLSFSQYISIVIIIWLIFIFIKNRRTKNEYA